MRVLHVYKDYLPVLGGIENHVRALAEAQVRRGHAVTVLVTAPGLRSETVRGKNGLAVPVETGEELALVLRSPEKRAFNRASWILKVEMFVGIVVMGFGLS